MKLYLSGPMTGIPELNFPEFERCATMLREMGHEVVSPHEIPDAGDWDGCLKADLIQMLECESVIVLDGWHKSRGARFEVTTAIQVGMRVGKFDAFVMYSTFNGL